MTVAAASEMKNLAQDRNSLHRALVLVLPSEKGALAREIDKGTCDRRIVADPNMHKASEAQEGTDIGEGLAGGPVMNVCNLRLIRNMAFICAFVSEDCDLRTCDNNLLGGDSGASSAEVV